MIASVKADPASMRVHFPHPQGIDFMTPELLQSMREEWTRSQVGGQRRTGWIVDGASGIELLPCQSSSQPVEEQTLPEGLIAGFRTEPDDGVSVEYWPEVADLAAGWYLGFSLVATRRGLLVIRRDVNSTVEKKWVSIWSPNTVGWVTLVLP